MIVSAPLSGEIAKSLASPTKREITPPLWSPKRVATKPGCRQLAARPMQAAGEFAREKNVAKLGAAIGFHGSKAFGQLQIVEIESGSLMRGRSCADDARRRGGQEPFAQPLGDNKIRHVIQRECAFEAIVSESAVGEHRPRVID